MNETESIKQDRWYARHRRERREKQRLGFLRIWEFIFFGIVGANVVALLFESQHSAHFDFDTWLNLADAVCAGVVLWLISQRKRVTRQVVCVYSLLMLTVGFVGDLILNHFEFSFIYFVHHGRGFFLFAGLYFLFSKKVRSLLNKPFNLHGGVHHAASESDLYRLRDPGFLRDLVMYFMVFSVVGHWMERFYAVVMRDTGGPYDPSAPMWQSYLAPFSIYGIGAVACIVLLFPLKQILTRKFKNIFLVLLVVYVANTLVCTGLELAVGVTLNHPGPDGKLIYWDYHDRPFNFMGQICLQNALAFGAVATVMVWVIFPAAESFILTLSDDQANVSFVAIAIVWLLLAAFYLITLPSPDTLSASATVSVSAPSVFLSPDTLSASATRHLLQVTGV
jgi:uncharacterized membrane protein